MNPIEKMSNSDNGDNFSEFLPIITQNIIIWVHNEGHGPQKGIFVLNMTINNLN